MPRSYWSTSPALNAVFVHPHWALAEGVGRKSIASISCFIIRFMIPYINGEYFVANTLDVMLLPLPLLCCVRSLYRDLCAPTSFMARGYGTYLFLPLRFSSSRCLLRSAAVFFFLSDFSILRSFQTRSSLRA